MERYDNGRNTTTPEQERIIREVVDAAYSVHAALGPGLLESVYHHCLCRELLLRSIPFRSEVYLPVSYKGEVFESGLRIDILVGTALIVELKTAPAQPLYFAQLLTYMKLSGARIGLLLNFNVPRIKDGIRRVTL